MTELSGQEREMVKRANLKLREADVLRAILGYLKVHRIFHWRNHTAGAKLGQRFVRLGVAGAPDIFIVHHGRCIGVEVKAPDGKTSWEQIAFGMDLEKAGGIYTVARSIEDVDEILRRAARAEERSGA